MNVSLRLLVISACFLSLWMGLIIVFHLPQYILPTPLSILKSLQLNWHLVIQESSTTILETFIGLSVGIVVGALAALLMAFFQPIKTWLLPLLLVSQAIPVFAIAPLLVIWFGYGMASKIVVTVLMLFYPITSSFYDGLQKTHLGWLDLAKTMQASKWRTFLYIRIPAALPSFGSGLRIATAIAPIGTIVGEWVGASHGLGYLMLNANGRMQIDLMFATLFVIMIFSLLLYFAVDFLLRSIITWQN